MLQCLSEYGGEDQFMTRIGVNGLVNIEKMKQVQTVLDDISVFHSIAQGTASIESLPW